MINFARPIYCLITGASRGIGRTIAVEFARKAKDTITFVLIARSVAGLQETKKLIEGVNKNAKIIVLNLDLSNVITECYENALNSTLVNVKKGDIENAFIFHNAGQLGTVKRVVDLSDILEWQNYYNLNLFSMTALNSIFIKKIRPVTNKISVVNITSLCGRKAFKYVSMYGTSKAARDLYFKILAEEEPEIKVLNYSPGMVDTDMADEFLTNLDNIQGIVEKDETKKSLLSPEQAISKMITILAKGDFTSGDIVDYYD